ALAEIVADRIGRLEVGQLQDAFVDGGKRQVRGLASPDAADLDGNLHARTRFDLFRRLDADLKRACAVVDAQPGDADRPPRAALLRLARTEGRGQGIGPGAPG